MPEPEMSRKGVRFTALRAVEADLGWETVWSASIWAVEAVEWRKTLCAVWRPRRSRQPSRCHTTNPATSNGGRRVLAAQRGKQPEVATRSRALHREASIGSFTTRP